jgi:hypothetical protein
LYRSNNTVHTYLFLADKWRGVGWNVAAISDTAWDWRGDQGSQCGKCKEVKCAAANFNDGYGQWLDRASVCFNTEASVILQITDTW